MAKKKTTKTKKSKSISNKKSGKKVKTMVKKKTTKKTITKKKATAKVKKNAAKKGTTKKASVKKTSISKVKKPRKSAVKKQEQIVDDFDARAASRAKAMKKIKGYSKKELDHFRNIIIEKRDEIINQLQNLKEQMMDISTGEYINENSPYSLHMAEQGTDAMEREKTFLYAQRETKFLSYLEAALQRIDNGIYGICLECIEEPKHLCDSCPLVPKARLEAVPHSQVCVPIKQLQEKKD
ncbi:MAG: conjugal transfer protein TraR [Ignavibacteriales bacterium CG_4_9_14_3_um_filter_30_11]|nr:MAG: conjugal transfer protein TraR [Ignavibacteriales bacterium CG_4_9_14_3_um_filter_30_11]